MSDLLERIKAKLVPPVMASFATIDEEGKPWVRYVMIAADDDLTIRFATSVKSRKVKQIEKTPEVHLTCGVTDLKSAQSYLQVQGRARVTTDQGERNRVWNPMLGKYFQGPDDPGFAVVVIEPYRIEFMGMDSMEPRVWEAK